MNKHLKYTLKTRTPIALGAAVSVLIPVYFGVTVFVAPLGLAFYLIIATSLEYCLD